MCNIEDMILFEDKEIVVCHKMAGVAVQNARVGAADMESMLMNYLATRNPGKIPYLGIVHRLDQPVEGVLVFAKTKKAAAGLTKQITSGSVIKEYLAVTDRMPAKQKDRLEEFLKKDGRSNTSSVVTDKIQGAKKAVLDYEVLEELEDDRTGTGKRVLVKIQLETGRHHQIRVQMAHAGMALLGDRKYNAGDKSGLPLGLCSCHLVFRHPTNGKKMGFRVTPKGECFAGFPNL
ncbi:RluA family pseudouridine synthase [Blautia sp. MSJ-19]|uniref:RluA family pseudouridine synthase n=1 Tax=Blautia sp. MSJ-19 TaxID=2841517 RepID=UPI001C0EC1A1|nr:RluA family pseudouridine synthase [Blautia sp. MSJ-19]MBU5480186.1 RluA family pseudouridine synthase [Blautia sp. MSJ-19]